MEELPLTRGTGKCIRNSHPDRDRTTKYAELIEKAKTGFSGEEVAQTFVAQLIQRKPRYVRDQLSAVVKLQEKFTKAELLRAVSYCVERALFTATDFRDTLEYFAVKQAQPCAEGSALSLKYSLVTAQERPLSAYAALAEGGGTQ